MANIQPLDLKLGDNPKLGDKMHTRSLQPPTSKGVTQQLKQLVKYT